MSISEDQIRDALRSVRYPGFSRDIVSFGLVKDVQIDNGDELTFTKVSDTCKLREKHVLQTWKPWKAK